MHEIDPEEAYARYFASIESILGGLDVDDETGEIVLAGYWGEVRFSQECERFDSSTDLMSFLSRFHFRDDGRTIEGGGSIRFVLEESQVNDELDWMLPYIMEELAEQDAIPQLSPVEDESRIFTFRDASKSPLITNVKIDLVNVNKELIAYLARHPEKMYTLDPRVFEELVAETFRDLGYETMLTPRTRDGGYDVRAIHRDDIGTYLYLIECKRYAPDNKVGVEVVRSLYGTAMAEQATYAIIATTSYFSQDAQEWAKRIQYQMSLRDFQDLNGWLRNYRGEAYRR